MLRLSLVEAQRPVVAPDTVIIREETGDREQGAGNSGRNSYQATGCNPWVFSLNYPLTSDL
jgi:hypothetical protein